jgi:hypothetical protein
MPTKPEQQSYLIGTYLTPDLALAVASVKRQDASYPSAIDCIVRLDGISMPLSTCCSADSEAVFMLDVQPQYGHDYVLTVSLGDQAATGVISTPAREYVTSLIKPSPDSLSFTPGEPIYVQWKYEGPLPTGFYLMASSHPGADHIPTVWSIRMDPDATSGWIPVSVTKAWSTAERSTVGVRAFLVGSIEGTLAAEGSWTQVPISQATLIMTRDEGVR